MILISRQRDAFYADKVEDDRRILIYEGHDIVRQNGTRNPKIFDQLMWNPCGMLTWIGLFYRAAMKYKEGSGHAGLTKVCEKFAQVSGFTMVCLN